MTKDIDKDLIKKIEGGICLHSKVSKFVSEKYYHFNDRTYVIYRTVPYNTFLSIEEVK